MEGENARKASVAGSDESLEYLESQDDSANSVHSIPGKEYDDSVKKLINDLEKSDESIYSQNSTESNNMDTTVVDTENKAREPGEKSPLKTPLCLCMSQIPQECNIRHS